MYLVLNLDYDKKIEKNDRTRICDGGQPDIIRSIFKCGDGVMEWNKKFTVTAEEMKEYQKKIQAKVTKEYGKEQAKHKKQGVPKRMSPASPTDDKRSWMKEARSLGNAYSEFNGVRQDLSKKLREIDQRASKQFDAPTVEKLGPWSVNTSQDMGESLDIMHNGLEGSPRVFGEGDDHY
jgi:hypothetical protein